MSVIEIERAFEKLSAREQEEFAEWYEAKLASGGFTPENEEAWVIEIERRSDELESGKVQAVSGEQVFDELKKRYDRKA